MIDTIRGYIDLENKNYSDFEHFFINETKAMKNDGYIISFNLSNFRITIKFDIDDKPIKLYFNGSLPKFYFGNNLAMLDWETTNEALQMLSDNLNIDIHEAFLTRIDFGINFIVKKPVRQYIPCLVDHSRLERIQRKDSVTFYSKSGSKSFIFYDKLKEIKDTNKTIKASIPEEYQNLNILRYEIRLEHLAKHKLKASRLQVKDLYDDTVQKKLVSLWLKGYRKIKKVSIGKDPLNLITERNGLNKYISFHGIEKLSYERIINTISVVDLKVKNPSVKRSKMKASINQLLEEVNTTTLDENLVKEMDDKIEIIKNLIS